MVATGCIPSFVDGEIKVTEACLPQQIRYLGMGKLLSHCWISDCMVASLRQKVAQLQIHHSDQLITQRLVDADDLLLCCFSNLDGSPEGCTVLHLLYKQWWQLCIEDGAGIPTPLVKLIFHLDHMLVKIKIMCFGP